MRRRSFCAEGDPVFTIDNRTGNILTTIAAFAAVVAVVFVARATLVAFVLALLTAYLLEPIVAGLEGLLPKGSHSRGASIAVVYAVGTVVAIAAAYSIVPTASAELRRFNSWLPDLAARVNAMSIAGRRDLMAGLTARATEAAASAAENAVWLLVVPVVAIFFLENRTAFLDAVVDLSRKRGDRAKARRTVHHIDEALAQYTRAQLILAALSAAFYVVSMALLRIPHAVALGIVGGVFEFVPVLGWIIAAIAMLVSAWLAHAHWMWMAALIVIWRVVQNFVSSPRVMGERLQMEPLSVLFALMVGSEIGGLAGAILSIPVVAVLRIVWTERASRDTSPVALVKK
jgi:predicted PurR-regulated permease PerM